MSKQTYVLKKDLEDCFNDFKWNSVTFKYNGEQLKDDTGDYKFYSFNNVYFLSKI